ncbi:MAG: thioredoxin-disulfide reductase [Chloroflexi bacterium]|nr:thioredoxin-disulfide reductase [Chloroflexota bacterium]|tara:strand:+ start:756 stop:1664 length:909 start_codon:yes stop_codon:yes gene_type:complete
MTDFDVAILGGGLAGLTAGLYATREGLNVTLFDQMGPGGQLNNVGQIDNFPGFPNGTTGTELASSTAEQALNAGLQFQFGEVSRLTTSENVWSVQTMMETVTSKTVIVALGSTFAKLNVPGEDKFFGKGISNCATCDGDFFRDEDVAIIGAGDSALDEALHLTDIVRSITVINKNEDFTGTFVNRDKLLSFDKVTVEHNAVVQALHGDDQLKSITVIVDGNEKKLDVTGAFVFVGLVPNSNILEGLLDIDAAGHVECNIDMSTAQPGLYVAGDIRQYSSRQLVSVAGDGATAAISARDYLRK